jgi:hypothetical protein
MPVEGFSHYLDRFLPGWPRGFARPAACPPTAPPFDANGIAGGQGPQRPCVAARPCLSVSCRLTYYDGNILIGTHRICSFYYTKVTVDVWVGAVATLAGAMLGGVISYFLSRQQIKAAQVQRTEAEGHERARRSLEHRFDAYADFLTHARRYRNAIRPYRLASGPVLTLPEIDALAAAADASGSLVFLVNENAATETACRNVLRSLESSMTVIHELESGPGTVPWKELNDDMSHALREFQSAARAELNVNVERLSA